MKFRKIIMLPILAMAAVATTSCDLLDGVVNSITGLINGQGITSKVDYSYYNNGGITDSMTGSTLLSKLQTLNNQKRTRLVGFNNMEYKYPKTDPGKVKGHITVFYSGEDASYVGMNKEHVWPASRLVAGRNQNAIEDDIHMIRPASAGDNQGRGNAFYGIGSGTFDPGSLGDETYRGDAARIIFYCVVADRNLGLVDEFTDSTSNHTMGKLSNLLQWNLKYPVKDREYTRNTEAEKLQGNRNPFIDHPEYACKIWGKTNAATKSICGIK